MIARNDITRALIMTKPVSDTYRDNYDAIFGKKKKPVEVEVEEPDEGQVNEKLLAYLKSAPDDTAK